MAWCLAPTSGQRAIVAIAAPIPIHYVRTAYTHGNLQYEIAFATISTVSCLL
jgi:hypothetical protein